MKDAGLTPKQINEAVLVGGSTQYPAAITELAWKSSSSARHTVG